MFEQMPGFGPQPKVMAQFDELFERRYPSRTPTARVYQPSPGDHSEYVDNGDGTGYWRSKDGWERRL
jgi:hypothetical protein